MYREMNLEDAARLIEMLGGVEKVVALLADRPPVGFKCGSFNFGQVEALCNKLGGVENAKAIVRGEREISVADAIRLLIDKNGRCIPQPEVASAVCDPNSRHFFDPTGKVNFAALAKRARKLFGEAAILPKDLNLAATFARLEEKVRSLKKIANLLNGPHYDVILPQRKGDDYGEVIENPLLLALAKAYKRAFPDRQFINHRQNQLAGKVRIEDARHQKLWNDLAKEPVVGTLCYPMQGFCVNAQREMAKLMPDFISLAGPYEAIVATAMWPKQLSRDYYTPVQDCSAVSWQSSASSLCLVAVGDKLEFYDRFSLDDAFGNYTGGLFVRG